MTSEHCNGGKSTMVDPHKVVGNIVIAKACHITSLSRVCKMVWGEQADKDTGRGGCGCNCWEEQPWKKKSNKNVAYVAISSKKAILLKMGVLGHYYSYHWLLRLQRFLLLYLF